MGKVKQEGYKPRLKIKIKVWLNGGQILHGEYYRLEVVEFNLGDIDFNKVVFHCQEKEVDGLEYLCIDCACLIGCEDCLKNYEVTWYDGPCRPLDCIEHDGKENIMNKAGLFILRISVFMLRIEFHKRWQTKRPVCFHNHSRWKAEKMLRFCIASHYCDINFFFNSPGH